MLPWSRADTRAFFEHEFYTVLAPQLLRAPSTAVDRLGAVEAHCAVYLLGASFGAVGALITVDALRLGFITLISPRRALCGYGGASRAAMSHAARQLLLGAN